MLRKLHSYIGIYVCWLLFVIAFFGSVSYFRNEINFYMQPTLHEKSKFTNAIDYNDLKNAINFAQDKYKNYDFISIKTPSYFNNIYEINFYNFNSSKGERKTNITYYNNEELPKTNTLGAKFLTSIHYKLLPINGGLKDVFEAIVSIFAIGIMFLYLSGIFIWNKKNFNKINTKNELVKLFDFHIVTGLFIGAFLFILAFSGIGLNYLKDIEKLFTNDTNKQVKNIKMPDIDKDFVFNTENIISAAKDLNKDEFIITLNKSKKEFSIALNKSKDIMTTFSAKNNHTYVFDNEANLKQSLKETKLSLISSFYEILFNIHRVPFADFKLNFILFLCGIVTCLFIYKAMLLASKKHKDKLLYKAIAYAAFYPCLNATLVYFIFNKLLQNINLEQIAFYIVFIVSIILSFIFAKKEKILYLVSMFILFILVVVDLVFSSLNLVVICFDITALIMICIFYLNLKKGKQ